MLGSDAESRVRTAAIAHRGAVLGPGVKIEERVVYSLPAQAGSPRRGAPVAKCGAPWRAHVAWHVCGSARGEGRG